MRQYYFINKEDEGARILFAGEQECKSGHSFGPYIREHYLIHFCLSGKGRIYDKNGESEVREGELFIIRPGEVTTYTADKREPWHYMWIAFSGRVGDALLDVPTVNRIPDGIKDRLQVLKDIDESATLMYKSLIYELIYRLAVQSDDREGYDRLGRIRRHIKYNYMQRLRISEISDEFGFERSYLYRAFKKRYGIGVKEYIIKVRMERARELLRCGYNVSESAHLVGYEDEFNFSRAFKQYFGESPVKFKNK